MSIWYQGKNIFIASSQSPTILRLAPVQPAVCLKHLVLPRACESEPFCLVSPTGCFVQPMYRGDVSSASSTSLIIDGVWARARALKLACLHWLWIVGASKWSSRQVWTFSASYVAARTLAALKQEKSGVSEALLFSDVPKVHCLFFRLLPFSAAEQSGLLSRHIPRLLCRAPGGLTPGARGLCLPADESCGRCLWGW